MKLLRSLACALLALTVSLSAATPPETTAFVNVTVLPMDANRTLPDHTVLVRGDRIIQVGPSTDVAVPADVRRIEARGKFLLPGFGEMHGHNPPPGSSPQYVADTYFLFLAHGVTTVRSMLGWPGQLELREQVKKGELLGPNLYLAGPSFSGQSTPTPAAAEQRVRQQKAEGWDLLKVHPGVRRESYDAMVATAREVGISYAGHIPADVGILHAIAQGQETVDHLDGYIEYLEGDRGPLDPAKLADVVRRTREAGIAVVPTMILWETIIGAGDPAAMHAFPELKYMPPAEVDRWKATYERRLAAPNFDAARTRRIADNRKLLLKALRDGGVNILFGTDAPQQFSVPGFSIHREVASMAESGLTPYEILHSATRAVGDHLKAHDTFGTVTAGSRADLILLDGNPLTDLKALQQRAGVMIRGRWLSEREIQEGLAEIVARNGR
jgi:imidazolonepropionase-like amidohydrolase